MKQCNSPVVPSSKLFSLLTSLKSKKGQEDAHVSLITKDQPRTVSEEKPGAFVESGKYPHFLTDQLQVYIHLGFH